MHRVRLHWRSGLRNAMVARCRALAGAIVLAAAAVLAPSAARAYCLNPSSTNPTLKQALTSYHKGSSGTTTIQLEQGTYPLDVFLWFDTLGDTGNLDVEGGYLPGHGCSESFRSKDASTTKLDGGMSGAFVFAYNGVGKFAVLEFENFQGNSGISIAVDSSGDVILDHVISNSNRQVTIVGVGNVIVKDALVYGQPAGVGQPALYVAAEDETVTVTNTTIADNKSGGLMFDQEPGAGGWNGYRAKVEAFNLIAWHNAGNDVDVQYVDYSINPKVYASIVGQTTPDVYTYGVLSTDPMFVNPDAGAASDYHVVASGGTVSPAVNGGTSAVLNGLPATDIEGNPRMLAGAPDMGAYEMDTPYYSTYVVTTTADNGSDAAPTANSLRWALKNARADAQSQIAGAPRKMQIAFNVPCPSMLALDTAHPLAAIDFDVTIDATTNPGWFATTGNPAFNGVLCVGINGGGAVANAFHVVSGGRATVRGMRFGGFADAAIRIDDSVGSIVAGNQIGGAGVGAFGLFDSNHDGVRISGAASGNFIGAFDDIGTMNQISDNTDVGVYVDSTPPAGAAPNYVVNNVIGLASDGASAYANGNGVYIYNSPNNVIEYNLIGGSTGAGVTLSGAATQGTRVQYNEIGVPWTGDGDVSNGSYAVLVSAGAANNTIGADPGSPGGGNGIMADGTGVYVSTSGGSGNRVLANTIQTGGGLPIDLGASGATANDGFDVDTGPNQLQNYPVVFAAHRTDKYLWIEGSLDSSVYTTFRLDFYWMCCPDASGRGQASIYLGNGTAGTDGVGLAPHFWVRLPSPALEIPTLSLGAISGTATDAAGNTSEIGIVGAEDSDMIFRDDFAKH